MKKMIVFDQDDTINITKLPIDQEMARLLKILLQKYQVCVISGTNWEIMKKNDIAPLEKIGGIAFEKYFIMPTTGTQFWSYLGNQVIDLVDNEQIVDAGWKREYAYFLSEEQIEVAMERLEYAAKQLGYWCDNPSGEIIEDRQSQVTFSALGQWATPEQKREWDPDMKKRAAIVKLIAADLSEIGLEIARGGATSIDITLPGIDKAYGMSKLMEQTGLGKKEILFIGDKLQPGGNDYPVKALGIDCIEVQSCNDTKWILRGILALT